MADPLAVDNVKTLTDLVRHPFFFCGVVGAVMPTIVRAFQVYGNGRTLPVKNWWAFSIVSVLYAISAGFFSFYLHPNNTFHALWAGISFSVIVTNLFESGKKVTARKTAEITGTGTKRSATSKAKSAMASGTGLDMGNVAAADAKSAGE